MMKSIYSGLAIFLFVLSSNAQKDKIYFSYRSSGNIIFCISSDNKTGNAFVAGKKYTKGKIKENRYDKKIFDFYINNFTVFNFFYANDSDIVVLNQKYELPIGEKAIELHPVNQPENMKLLYEEQSKYIPDSIPLMNDKAYYLEQYGIYKEAIFILNKVIEKRPDRVVAYLNLADAYWGDNKKSEAKLNYQKYIDMMKSQGKNTDKIPQRVYDRLKQ